MTLASLDPHRILAPLTALCFSVLVGFALATSPALAVGGVVGATLVAMTVRRPEVGALAILVLVAIVPRSVLFEQGIPLGGGNLKVTDVLLAATIGSWLAARAVNPGRYPLPSLPTTLLILGFLVLALASVVTADAMGTPRKLSLLELRPLLSYLLVFPLVSAARSWVQLRIWIVVLLGAAALSAGSSIVQYALGIGSDATFTGGALRVDSATFLFPMIAALWALALLAYVPTSPVRWATLGLAAVAITGLFFTFSRGAWLALLAGGFVVVVLLRPWRRVRALGWLVPLVVVAAASIVAFNAVSTRRVANPLAAGLDRLMSVGDSEDDVSSRYRVVEWKTAIDEITRHPLTGIGLGSSITFTNPMFSPSSNSYGFTFSTFYIHNSYLWFALKIGVVGALMFFALIARVAWMALVGFWRAHDPREEMMLLACLGSLFAILVLSVTGPHLNVDSATPAVAALIAGIEIARRLGARDVEEATA
jgi:O-antigen ligase